MDSPELALQPDSTRLTLPRFLEDVCSRYGDRVALRFEGRSLLFRELAQEVELLARGLAAAGVSKGARVALYLANRPEWVIAAFAVARLGGVVVPLTTFASAPERDYILRHSDASTLLMQRELLGRDLLDELQTGHKELAEGRPGALHCAALPQLRRIFCTGLEGQSGGVQGFDRLRALADPVPVALVAGMAEAVEPADDAMIIYTSGTTAHPKGVVHMQRAPVIMSWRYVDLYGLEPDDVIWTAQPFFWTAGMSMSLGASLAAGARLVLEESFDAASALALFESEGVTAPFCWTHQEEALAQHPSIAERDLSGLRRVNFDSPLARHAGLVEDEWGFRGCSYGMTETFTLATAFHASAPAALRRASSGPPLPGNRLRIVDPESGAVCATGERGEIAVKGLTTMRGYYKVDPELCFDSDGYFHTQDGGYLDAEGRLHWEGRLSALIKTGGANVSPLEIESVLVDYPGLHLAQAVGVPHPTLGEAIVLCVVESKGQPLDFEALRRHLRLKLAAYKVPKQVLCFGPEELSFTGSQKLQLAPLREAALTKLEEDGIEIAGARFSATSGAD